jgi:hypothetical protein
MVCPIVRRAALLASVDAYLRGWSFVPHPGETMDFSESLPRVTRYLSGSIDVILLYPRVLIDLPDKVLPIRF